MIDFTDDKTELALKIIQASSITHYIILYNTFLLLAISFYRSRLILPQISTPIDGCDRTHIGPGRRILCHSGGKPVTYVDIKNTLAYNYLKDIERRWPAKWMR